jgi:hypothetical protein
MEKRGKGNRGIGKDRQREKRGGRFLCPFPVYPLSHFTRFVS